jgi:hypothetical protein
MYPWVRAEACLDSLDASPLAASSPGSPWPQVRRERGETLTNTSRDCQGESHLIGWKARKLERGKAGRLLGEPGVTLTDLAVVSIGAVTDLSVNRNTGSSPPDIIEYGQGRAARDPQQ